MKVEQRIGRLDRIGQKHDNVLVLNLCYLGSNEEIVYGRLLRRLRDAGKIVGAQQMSMLPVRQEEFRQLADGELEEGELEDIAIQRAEEQQERTQSMEIPPKDRYQIYIRMEREREKTPLPVDLEAIWSTLSQSRYLHDLGCAIPEESDQNMMIVRGVEGIPEKTVLTTSRQLYEEGLPENGVRPHFASYGDPYFDKTMDHFAQFDLPDCVRRLRLNNEDYPAEVVGYVAVCTDQEGNEEVKLITSWQQLVGVQLAENSVLSDEMIERARGKLRRLARDEFEATRKVKLIERENVRAGRAQLAFTYLLAGGLVKMGKKSAPSEDNYWAIARNIEDLLKEKTEFSVPDLPAEPLREIEDQLLFSLKIPSVGPRAMILASSTMLQSAFDAACRQADSMKVRKSELGVDTVINRLERQAEEAMKAFRSL